MNMKFNQFERFLRTSKTNVTKASDTKTLTAIKDGIKKYTKLGLFNQGMLAEFNSGEKKFKKLSETATKIVDNAEFLDVDGLVQQINSVQVPIEGLQRDQEELSKLLDDKAMLLQEKTDCQVWISELTQKNQTLAGQLKELMDQATKIRKDMAENTSQITQLNNRSNRAEGNISKLDKKIKHLIRVIINYFISFIQEVDKLELEIKKIELTTLKFDMEDKKNLIQHSPMQPSRPAPLPPAEREGQNMSNLGANSSNTLSKVSVDNPQNQGQKR